MKHDNDLKYWKKEADRLFSLYIRQRFAKNDMVKCATCDSIKNWREMDCGHFRIRKHNSTRCHPHNALAQCPHCNRGYAGNNPKGEQYLMGLKLDEIFGEGTAQKMIELSRESVKMSWLDWKGIAERYKELLKSNNCQIR